VNRRTAISTLALAAAPAIAGPVGLRLPGGFDPRQILGLQLWLDASQIVGLNDGDSVGTWSDLSGNANDATQGTASKKPLYKTAIVNGKPVVRFDGVDDFLSNATLTALNGVSAATLFTVKKETTYTGISFPFYTAANLYKFNVGGTRYYRTSATEDANASSSTLWGSWTYEGMLYDGSQSGNSNRLKVRSNGSPLAVGYTGTIQSTLGSGTGFYVSTYDGTTYPWNGDVAEIILFNRAVTGADLTNLEAYLASKYGL